MVNQNCYLEKKNEKAGGARGRADNYFQFSVIQMFEVNYSLCT